VFVDIIFGYIAQPQCVFVSLTPAVLNIRLDLWNARHRRLHTPPQLIHICATIAFIPFPFSVRLCRDMNEVEFVFVTFVSHMALQPQSSGLRLIFAAF